MTMQRFHISENRRRGGIILIGCAWAATSMAYANYAGNERVWSPWLVSGLFIVAAALVWAFAAQPTNRILYLLSGAVSVVAIAARAASVAVGAAFVSDDDAVWITVAQISITAVLFMLLWWFWQTEVKVWHTYHATRRRQQRRRHM